jgi:cation diffusion facilitator CzcD-associated flavoprotein CzcO
MGTNDGQAARDRFADWTEKLSIAWAEEDGDSFASLFIDGAHWKDILAFTWDFRIFSGRAAISDAYRKLWGTIKPTNVRVAEDRTAPRKVDRGNGVVIEGFVNFDTSVGHCTAFVRLASHRDEIEAPHALVLHTTLQELHGFEVAMGKDRPSGLEYSYSFEGDNWLDRRLKAREFVDRSPDVVIVGGGQNGLALAARLEHFGVRALIVERNPRIGDNWRNRYHSLTLHNDTPSNHMPFLEFPPTWPSYLPKDKLAGWLEYYAEAMELNIWTNAEVLSATFEEPTGLWSVRILRDSEEEMVSAPHVVMATGIVSGIPYLPEIEGISRFRGEVIHSKDFITPTPYAGKNAIVIGSGTSGHDIAQELYCNGVGKVTIFQRSPTTVLSLRPSAEVYYTLYSEMPAEDADLIASASSYEELLAQLKIVANITKLLDENLLNRLHAVGFETDFGDDETGWFMKYYRKGGGYYFNVGCSELIADGKVDLAHSTDLDAVTATGMRLKDGREIAADVIILATGYRNQQEGTRQIFGDEVAEKVGKIWGIDEAGFIRNMWKRTAQKNLWVMGGGLAEARPYSRYLALQIKGALEGMLPENPL